MGSAQSHLSSESIGTALTGLVIAGAIGISLTRVSGGGPAHLANKNDSVVVSVTKKKRQTKGVSSRVPPTIPGQFDHVDSPPVTTTTTTQQQPENARIPKAKKPKRKKNAEDPSSSISSLLPPDSESSSIIQPVPEPRKRFPKPQTPEITTTTSSGPTTTRAPGPKKLQLSSVTQFTTIALDTDDSWTQVSSRRSTSTRRRKSTTTLRHPQQQHHQPSEGGESQSETTTRSQRDDSSPVRNIISNPVPEDDPHDSFLLQQSILPSSSRVLENRKSLVERLSPKPRKTDTDNLLKTSDFRDTPLSKDPMAGFSWADYEDVRVTTDGGENDADGEDDGWGVVTSKRPKRINISSSTTSRSSLKAPETLTKKQRQNALKRERQKSAKAEAESGRLASLAGHKRELEKARLEELYGKETGSKPRMKATVDERGKLIWE